MDVGGKKPLRLGIDTLANVLELEDEYPPLCGD